MVDSTLLNFEPKSNEVFQIAQKLFFFKWSGSTSNIPARYDNLLFQGN